MRILIARSALLTTLLLTIGTPDSLRAQDADDGALHPTLEDLFTVKSLGGLALSPDGRHLLYAVTSRILDSNKTNSDIWMVSTAGDHEPIQLTHNPDDDSRPAWKPDGSAFVFLSSRGDGEKRRPSLYLMRAFGGEAEKLYTHATGIGQFAWSPDGTSIAFTASDEEPQESKDDKKIGRDIEIEDDPGEYRHLWVLDLQTREAKRMTDGREYTVGGFSWSPDNRHLAFSATPTTLPPDSWKSDVYVLEAVDSAVPTRITTNPGPDGTPRWTPDGEWIVFSGRETEVLRLGYNRLYRIRPDGSGREDISPRADLSPSVQAFSSDGWGLFFQSVTGTTTGLFYMPVESREVFRLSPGAGMYGSATFSEDRNTVAFVHQSPTAPVEIFAAELPDRPYEEALQNGRALTSHNADAKGWAVGRTEVIRWPSRDGREIEGLVVLPAGWSEGDGPHALITKIHGGPSGVHLQSFQAASSGADAQRYAADGYAVFLPNPRGSRGYGDESQRLVIEDWGGRDFEDIMSGIDYLIDRGIAHSDSLGVMGWSYGGYMTAWTVTQTDRFKGAVAGAAITETISMWGTQDIVQVFEAYFGGGPYEQDRWEVYQRSNPLAFITQATTPTMVIHGKNDPRVPPNQARTFFRALRANGVPTKLVWLPRTGHGPREPGLQYETARSQKAWLDQWIRKRPGVTASDED